MCVCVGVCARMCCVYYAVDQGDVEAVEKVCQRILGDGLSRDDLRSNTVTRVENFLNQNNRPVPAWVCQLLVFISSMCAYTIAHFDAHRTKVCYMLNTLLLVYAVYSVHAHK